MKKRIQNSTERGMTRIHGSPWKFKRTKFIELAALKFMVETLQLGIAYAPVGCNREIEIILRAIERIELCFLEWGELKVVKSETDT